MRWTGLIIATAVFGLVVAFATISTTDPGLIIT